MPDVTGKVVIITGASSGLGRAAARLFARNGARVVLGARRAAELETLAAEIAQAGGEAVAVAGDVRNEDDARALVETAVRRYGGLDAAFNNAGIMGEMAPVSAIAAHDWRDVLDTNLTGAFFAAKHQVPAILERGGGSIVFTSSFVGYSAGMPNTAAYAASKAGMIGLAKTLAAEYGSQGLRSNALLPGGVDTPANIANAPDATPDVWAFVEGLHALKRIAAPDEVARAALYLVSDEASFVTGSAMLVDGGVSISRM